MYKHVSGGTSCSAEQVSAHATSLEAILLVPVTQSTPPSSVISCEAYLICLILQRSSYDTVLADSTPQSKFLIN